MSRHRRPYNLIESMKPLDSNDCIRLFFVNYMSELCRITIQHYSPIIILIFYAVEINLHTNETLAYY